MGNSEEAQVVPVGFLGPHLTVGPHGWAEVLVSSSETCSVSYNSAPVSATAAALCSVPPLSAHPDKVPPASSGTSSERR